MGSIREGLGKLLFKILSVLKLAFNIACLRAPVTLSSTHRFRYVAEVLSSLIHPHHLLPPPTGPSFHTIMSARLRQFSRRSTIARPLPAFPFRRPFNAGRGRRFQSKIAEASTAAQQSFFQRMWNSPVGLKTVHFWLVFLSKSKKLFLFLF